MLSKFYRSIRPNTIIIRHFLWLMVGVSVLLSLAKFHSFPVGTFFVDDAEYIIMAEALSSGQGYYLINFPYHQPRGSFPPGWPLLLAPATAVFPNNFDALRAVSLLLWLSALPLLYRLLAERFNKPYTEIVLLLIVINPHLVTMSGVVMSEAAYLFFSLLTISLFHHWERQGLLAWTWFQSSLHHATGAIVNNPELIKRPGFPTAILPIVTVCNHLIHYLLALPILLIFLWIVGLKPDATLLALPLLLLLQFLFILGLAYLAATLHVVFRDTEHLLVIALFLLFYLSPVFYDVQLLPEYARRLFALNPLVHLLEAHRSILLEQRLPDWPPLLLLALFSTLLLAGSYRLFNKMSDSFVEEL
jgi:lipopolysaccharide transport system permease protein